MMCVKIHVFLLCHRPARSSFFGLVHTVIQKPPFFVKKFFKLCGSSVFFRYLSVITDLEKFERRTYIFLKGCWLTLKVSVMNETFCVLQIKINCSL